MKFRARVWEGRRAAAGSYIAKRNRVSWILHSIVNTVVIRPHSPLQGQDDLLDCIRVIALLAVQAAGVVFGVAVAAAGVGGAAIDGEQRTGSGEWYDHTHTSECIYVAMLMTGRAVSSLM